MSDASQDFLAFTARFSRALQMQADAQARASLIARTTQELGEHGFPAFIKLMLVIAESRDTLTQHHFCEGFYLLLGRGQPPSGQLSGWGSSAFWDHTALTDMQSVNVNQLLFTPKRSYGPIEYLCVWYSQKTHRPYLDTPLFLQCLGKLLNLLSCTGEAPAYAGYLLTEAVTSAEGTYSRNTRDLMQQLAELWRQDSDTGRVLEKLESQLVDP